MKHGFLKVAAITPKVKVADPVYNAGIIREKMTEAYENGAKIIVFPELCLTAYTCGDLFLQDILLDAARKKLLEIADATKGMNAVVIVGLPWEKSGELYNVMAVIQDGKILGLVPKINIPDHGSYHEGRYFREGSKEVDSVYVEEEEIFFGANLLFECADMKGLVIGCEVGEDLEAFHPPCTEHARMGATVIVNSAASFECTGNTQYREMLVKSTSARLCCGYILANAGEGESTQDLVFGGHKLIGENGSVLAEAEAFGADVIYSELDIQRLVSERRRRKMSGKEKNPEYVTVYFDMDEEETVLSRNFGQMPFVPADEKERRKRCEEILAIQCHGLKKRYEHIGCKTAVLGISGGLDSTLALLVTVRTFDMLGLDRKNIIAVTMPCFGTTDRTYDNACRMTKTLGATLQEVDIKEAVKIHFRDIGHDQNIHDVTYENSQARERTQVIMDIANRAGGLVIGTGDLSELALGWATYNGDHMSMYGVNAGVPKTLIRHLVRFCADTADSQELKEVLLDVLDTPVSPELLPPVDGTIAQKTEDLVGPYELHDFFLYYFLRCGFSPEKIYRIALRTFHGIYSEETVKKWLKTFCRRFFQQQFKRSCLPDGPKVGSVAVSPRGDLQMPSDASASLWLAEADRL